MKRIEFIAPVEAMRGNLSGKQELLYAENDNAAYFAPEGRVNYARNYQPRFIGAKRASDGKKYFAVKTKTANHLTIASKHAMALLGGAGAVYAALLRNKTNTPYTSMLAFYEAGRAKGIITFTTFRAFAMDQIRWALVHHEQNISGQAAGVGSYSFKNPWYDGTMTSGAQVSSDILWKFWVELAPDAFVFQVEQRVGLGQGSIDFEAYVNKPYNNLGLIVQEGADTRVLLGDLYLKNGDNWVIGGDTVTAATTYTLTTESGRD